MTKTSKAKKIEKYMLKGRSITPLQALRMFGVYRLSSVINRLRRKGYNIVTIISGKEGYASYRMS